HTGYSFKASEASLIQIGELLVAVAEEARVYLEEQHVIRIESHVDVLQVSERANKLSLSDYEDHRERHLDHHQRLAQPRAANTTRAASRVFERRCQIHISLTERGQDAEDDAGEKREAESEAKHTQIEAWS